MKRWDLHCDALSKMILASDIRFEDDRRLDVTAKRLKEGGVQLQAFAIYVPEAWKGRPFDAVLASVDAFEQRIASRPDILPIRSKQDIETLMRPGETRIGAMLTMEGADALEGNLAYLRIAYALGVRTLGVTWNVANWAADGVREPRGGGLTAAGRRLVAECDRLGMTLDVSHLSVKGFWDVLETSRHAPIASHSNAKSLCDHPRNLSNDQIRALIAANGRIGITFVPYFLRSDGREAGIDDVLRHLDYVCGLGGADHVGFGSDFDGIETWVKGLEHPGGYETLAERLEKNYTSEQVEGFLRRNWLSYYQGRFM
ncbi:membrane dipeptidase [Paenibacillus antri]|uniref:Membrane dipeptidase n=1 Tax=Paenibacillus antri TaxID=2582848 RepID=A0A5R9GD69_9BACL|nr:dipeptidase [Paenibacillus antri]TLS52276.1 membrane dipeptidase [Paenibacillus antri]